MTPTRPLMPGPGQDPDPPASARSPRPLRTCPSRTVELDDAPVGAGAGGDDRAHVHRARADRDMRRAGLVRGSVLDMHQADLRSEAADERGGVDPADLHPVAVDLREYRRARRVEQVLECRPAVDDRGQLELVVVIAQGDASRGRELLRRPQLVCESPDRRTARRSGWDRPKARRVCRAPVPRSRPAARSCQCRRAGADAPPRPSGPDRTPTPARSGDRYRAGSRTRPRGSRHAPRAPALPGSPGRPHHAVSRAGSRWEGRHSCPRVCHHAVQPVVPSDTAGRRSVPHPVRLLHQSVIVVVDHTTYDAPALDRCPDGQAKQVGARHDASASGPRQARGSAPVMPRAGANTRRNG